MVGSYRKDIGIRGDLNGHIVTMRFMLGESSVDDE